MEPDPQAYDRAAARLLARGAVGRPVDPDRAAALAELLGRPDRAFPSIRVAGAGARSVARMTAALLGALDLTVGAYGATSLQDVRERIRVAGEPISRAGLLDRLAEIEPFLVEVDARFAEPLVLDEVLSALAFAHFTDAPVDVGVVEAAEEGADPVDLVRGEVVVIDEPPAGADPSWAARQVAGCREGTVVVTAPQPAEARRALAEACAERGVAVVEAGREAAVEARSLAVGGQQVDLRGVTGAVEDVYLPLHGAVQASRAVLALAAVEGFLGFAGGLDPAVIREGFAAVRVPGSVEVVRRTDAATVVLDTVPDESGAAALADALGDEFAFRHHILVTGPPTAADGGLVPLLALAGHVVAVAPPGAPAESERVATAARTAERSVETAATVEDALELASGLAGPEDGVVVAGPDGLVGGARQALGLPVG